MRILILGGLEDSFCREMKNQAFGLGYELEHLSDQDIVKHSQLNFRYHQGQSQSFITHHGIQLDLEAFDSIFYRSNHIPLEENLYSSTTKDYLLAEWRAFFNGFTNHLETTIIERPSPQLWYKTFLSPLDLLEFIYDLTFCIPETLISNDDLEIERFFRKAPFGIDYVPQSQPTFYSINDQKRLKCLQKLTAFMPLHLMQSLRGDVLNVYVAGDTMFVVDQDGGKISNSELNASFLKSCKILANRAGYSFTQMHFLKEGGDYYLMGMISLPTLDQCEKSVRADVVQHLLSDIKNSAS